MVKFMRSHSLSLRLILCVGVVAIAAIGGFAYINLETQRRHLIQEVISGAQQLSDTIKRSLWYDMLHNYRDALYNVIEVIGRQEGIEKVRIFNKEGMVMFSSHRGEEGKMVDKRAEACYACHAEDRPLERLDTPKRTRIYQANDHRILGMISPIYNEPACYNAPCHAHPPEQTVLGVLDVSLSLATADQRIKELKEKTILFATFTIMAISVIIGLFIRRAVHRPVKELVEGTKRIAHGDFDYTIPFSSKDELGQLAEAFNDMTQRLKRAHREIQELIRTLEQKVEERTEELKRAQYQLLQSEKLASIGKLAATIAHEINNPLNGILTYTKLIERKLAQDSLQRDEVERFRSYLTIMERETERCSNIVRNLLDFARQREPSLKPDVDVNAVVEEALSLVANRMALQEITLEKDYGKLPPITADPLQLRQAFLNILINSCEAIQDAGGLIRISTSFLPQQQRVKVEFSDNGIGIQEEDLHRIFDPFFTTKEKGTGLGLSVVYGIINSHQGKIEVRSKPKRGTTVSIELPTGLPIQDVAPGGGPVQRRDVVP